MFGRPQKCKTVNKFELFKEMCELTMPKRVRIEVTQQKLRAGFKLNKSNQLVANQHVRTQCLVSNNQLRKLTDHTKLRF